MNQYGSGLIGGLLIAGGAAAIAAGERKRFKRRPSPALVVVGVAMVVAGLFVWAFRL
jgi:hypothetical protein